MTDQQKIALVDRLLEEIKELGEQSTALQMVGKLSKSVGIKGFHRCEVDTPVFLRDGRYILYMETLDGKTVVEVAYQPEALKTHMILVGYLDHTTT